MLTRLKSWLRPDPVEEARTALARMASEADRARIIRAKGLEAVKRELEK